MSTTGRRLTGSLAGAERLIIRIVRGPARDPEIAKRLLLEDSGIVEEGFRILDAHLRAGRSSFIDLFAVDARGDFTLVELEQSGEEELLGRVRAHQAWVASQVHFLRKIYGVGSFSPFRPPKVVALAHSFTLQFLESLPALKIPVTPLHYRILMSGGSFLLYLEPAGDPSPDPTDLFPGEMDEPVLAPERLTAEEWDEFYGFEERRLAEERLSERVER